LRSKRPSGFASRPPSSTRRRGPRRERSSPTSSGGGARGDDDRDDPPPRGGRGGLGPGPGGGAGAPLPWASPRGRRGRGRPPSRAFRLPGILTLFARIAAAPDPGRLAVVGPDGALTWAELLARAERLAARLGPGPAPVVVYGRKEPAMLAGFV